MKAARTLILLLTLVLGAASPGAWLLIIWVMQR
jgi:hypothetical protein